MSIQASYIGAVSISPGTLTTVDIGIAAQTQELVDHAAVNTPTLLLQY